MGIYRAVGRPLFFALPPEAAHRAASTMLGWPLPWERIGAVPHDPRLHVDLAGIRLENPVGLAAGFDKTCRRLGPLGRLGFGYVVGGTVTRAPRSGNPTPRIVRYPADRSMVNAMGLPNPGARSASATLGRSQRTRPRFVSLADEAIDDVLDAFDLVEPVADAVELNVSCPNVSWGRDRDNETHLADLVARLGERRSKPLIVKLPPFVSDVEREVVLALARIAHEGGADALTCGNTRRVDDARLSTGFGGLSGAPLSSGTPRNVREVRRVTDERLPINACGGVMGPAEAMACLEAGATTVQVYTGLVYEGPRIVAGIVRGIQAAMRDRRVDLPGLVHAG